MTTDQQRLDANARQFDRIAARYDALGFLTRAALALVETVRVPTGGRALDVATGTGTVALALASQAAEVVGTDIAPAMLQQARARAVGCPNVQFVSAEATALPFADQSFDVVVCGAGLFFVPDMPAALREWRRVLRPGGEVVFSAFGRGLLGPLPGLWRETLAGEGIKPGAPPLGRIGTVEAASDLLVQAGFQGGAAELLVLPYTLPTPAERWSDIAAGLEGLPLADLTPEQRVALKTEHLKALQPLFAAGPLTVPLPLILAHGYRDAGEASGGGVAL